MSSASPFVERFAGIRTLGVGHVGGDACGEGLVAHVVHQAAARKGAQSEEQGGGFADQVDAAV